MHRRDVLKALLTLVAPAPAMAQGPAVSTLVGTGSPGYSAAARQQPWTDLSSGRTVRMYFCDLDNQRMRKIEVGDDERSPCPATARRATQVMVTAATEGFR